MPRLHRLLWLGALLGSAAQGCADADTTARLPPSAAVTRALERGPADVIVRLRPGARWTAPSGLQRSLRRVAPDFAVLRIDRRVYAHLQGDPSVQSIGLDFGGGGHLQESLPLAGIAAAHALGARGQGVTIALIDSGVDTSHPDLNGKISDEACFCSNNCCPGGLDTATGPGSAHDDNGHGTHLAGILSGRGVLGPLGGAPDATIIAIKVLDANNAFCCSSDLLAALSWLQQNHPEARVLNLSLGLNTLRTGDCDHADPTIEGLAVALDALRAAGTIVVASSGNNASSFSMAAPACIASVLSVGAVWDAALGAQLVHGCSESTTAADRVACFSNASATTDLLAPGALVTSSWPGGLTLTRAGTSLAAAVVSACLADLWSSEPLQGPDALESALKNTAMSVLDERNQRAYGRIDCAAALASLRAGGGGAAGGGDAAGGSAAAAGDSGAAGGGAAASGGARSGGAGGGGSAADGGGSRASGGGGAAASGGRSGTPADAAVAGATGSGAVGGATNAAEAGGSNGNAAPAAGGGGGRVGFGGAGSCGRGWQIYTDGGAGATATAAISCKPAAGAHAGAGTRASSPKHTHDSVDAKRVTPVGHGCGVRPAGGSAPTLLLWTLALLARPRRRWL